MVASTSGALTTYNGETLAAVGVPYILGNVALTSQTTSLGPTTIITTGAAGLYEVDVYFLVTAGSATSTVGTTIGWTDPAGAQSAMMQGANTNRSALFLNASGTALSTATTGTWLSGTMPIRCTASSAITYTTAVVNGPPTYSLYISVRRLS